MMLLMVVRSGILDVLNFLGDWLVMLAQHFRAVYKDLHADHETGAADNKTG